MSQLETLLPARRPELVCCPLEKDGRYLIRNRATGESFRLGAEEHFLLESLDGQQTAEDVRRAFGERFDEPLTGEELNEFIELSRERGLLAEHECPTDGPAAVPGPLEQTDGTPASTSAHPAFRKRATIRLLNGCAALLGWSTWLPNLVTGWIQQRVRDLQFTPRPDDVFIVTYPRSGTTWMQMILYQLTSDGNMDFPHIAEYCPWFERSVRSATAFETRPSPRLFKSHLPYKEIPKGPCKYIYVARDGKDVAVSYYHLDRMYNGFEGTFAEFFDKFLKGKTLFGSWFEHIKGWWEHRDDPNVLYLTYEALTHDLSGCIRRIAAFIGRDVPAERLPGIVERCSFDFMKQHESQFDPVMESLWEQGVRLKSFLRHGRVGDGTVSLTEEQQARFDEAFNKRLKPLRIPVS